MGRDPGEECFGLLFTVWAGEQRGRQRGGEAEASKRDGVAGEAEDGSEHLIQEIVDVVDERPHMPTVSVAVSSQPDGGRNERAMECHDLPVGQRMGQCDIGMDPFEPKAAEGERPEER